MAMIHFDDYAKKYQHIKFERRDGILQMTLHTNGGPWQWDARARPDGRGPGRRHHLFPGSRAGELSRLPPPH